MVLTLLGLVASKEAVFVSRDDAYDVFTGKKLGNSFEIQCVDALTGYFLLFLVKRG